MPTASTNGQTKTDEDRALMAAAQRDPTAFTVLYRRHLDRVYRYLRYRVGNEQDAQDLTMQTFLAALENLASYRNEGTVLAWLLGIAHHKLIDWRRKEQYRTEPLAWAEILPDPTSQPEAQVTQQLTREALEQALLMLAPERGEAIALRYFGELTNREVAAIMGKQESAVKMLVHRGLQDLRSRFRVQERVDEEVLFV